MSGVSLVEGERDEVEGGVVRCDRQGCAGGGVVDPGVADRHHVHRRTVRQALASGVAAAAEDPGAGVPPARGTQTRHRRVADR